MIKKVIIGLAILVVVLIVAGVLIWKNFDVIAKEVIERAGSHVTGTEVTVGAVSVSLQEGSATISDLAVANPPGFSDQPALFFGDVSAEIDIATGVIRRIHAGQPTIRVEIKGDGTNFTVLKSNIDRSSGDPEPESGGSGKPTELTINRIEIDQASAMLVPEDGDEPETVDIDELVFENLSGTPGEISRQILRQVIEDVVEATATQILMERAGQVIESKAAGLKEKLKSLTE